MLTIDNSLQQLTKHVTKDKMSAVCQQKNSFGWKISWLLIAAIGCCCLPLGKAAKMCEYNPAHTRANCSRRNLNYVPWSLHKSINSLDLSGNNFPELENQSFINYPSIRQLSLRNNSISAIKGGAFRSLNYLSILDLSNNKLERIPTDSLKMVAHSLETLNLAGNKLYIIPSRVFSNFQNLKELDLSGNSIYRVDHGAFLGLTSLVEFKIGHNALTSLPSDSFDDFPSVMNKVLLYDNRWFCDCNLRWLWTWLNATDSDVWKSRGYMIRCDGPAFIRDKSLSSVDLDKLACQVEMKTSGSTREIANGGNTTLLCKYSSEPEAEAVWRRDSTPIDLSKNANKYSVSSWALEDSFGFKTHVSELKIKKFKYHDIARYDCFVNNIRGAASTEYRLTLAGVDFDSVKAQQPDGQYHKSSLDTQSIVIAVAVVSGIILLVVIVILVFCSINRMQRKRKQKRDTIQENIKQHFMNSEASSNGDPASPDGKSHKMKPIDTRLDDTLDDHSKSNATMDSTFKPVPATDDVDHMYPFEQPGSPAFTNGNTYVSFGSELTDPNEFMPHPTPYSQAQPVRYEGSHAGSATPLLDRNTPSMYDSEEPVEDFAHYPVYDSVTNSLQHPNLPNNTNGYHSSDGGGGYDFLPNRQNSVASYASMGRNGAPGDRSFQYPPSYNGSMPRTPGSTRSGFTFPRSLDGDASPLGDPYGNHYQSRPPPQQSNYNTYDYRDAGRYPATTPPPHHMTPETKKSMSVGNLGYSPVPTSASGPGPRKPPRIYQSREYMELTPHDTSSDYISSADAQNYSQSYGITPGTPV